jgi:hypothetical protein
MCQRSTRNPSSSFSIATGLVASKQHDGPLQNRAGQLRAVDQFMIPGRDVPGIAEKNSIVRQIPSLFRATPFSSMPSLRHGRLRENRNFLDIFYQCEIGRIDAGSGVVLAGLSSMAGSAPPHA